MEALIEWVFVEGRFPGDGADRPIGETVKVCLFGVFRADLDFGVMGVLEAEGGESVREETLALMGDTPSGCKGKLSVTNSLYSAELIVPDMSLSMIAMSSANLNSSAC